MKRTFDFESNQWVEPPPSSVPTSLPPREGVWNSPAPAKPNTSCPVLIASGVLGTASILLISITHGASVPLLFVSIVLVFLATSGPEAMGIQATAKDRTLLEDNDDVDVCLVAVSIYRNGVEGLEGRDRGVAWFSDGQILFNGHRTSFAIGGQDILPPPQWPRWLTSSGPVELPDCILALAHPAGNVFVEFTPLVVPSERGNSRRAAEMRFLKRLYDFKRKPPFSTGPRQWPPLGPSRLVV